MRAALVPGLVAAALAGFATGGAPRSGADNLAYCTWEARAAGPWTPLRAPPARAIDLRRAADAYLKESAPERRTYEWWFSSSNGTLLGCRWGEPDGCTGSVLLFPRDAAVVEVPSTT
jgi:hypothetical protein